MPRGPATAASARLINAAAVLDHVWAGGPAHTFTANELIAATGLTRATVLAVCDDLLGMGWLDEWMGAADEPTAGRPPRRFALRPDAAYVVAVDIGELSIRGAVADLHGRIRGRSRRNAQFRDDQRVQRDEAIRAVIADSLTEAGITPEEVSVASFGLAAPVDATGRTPMSTRSTYWSKMSLDPTAVLAGRPGWTSLINNDANLAALAVGACGEADPAGSYVVLLAGERFGAGIIAEGRLLLGRDGAAGEMHFLELITGVENHYGLTGTSRRIHTTTSPALPPEDLFTKARSGDPAAAEVLRRLADRLARVIAVLASLLNPEQVVIGGAVAETADQLLQLCREQLPAYAELLPMITASQLGGDIVLLGAIRAGIKEVARTALTRTALTRTALTGQATPSHAV